MYFSSRLAELLAVSVIFSTAFANPLPVAEPEALPEPQNELSAAGIPGINITNANIAGTAAAIKGTYLIVYKGSAGDSAIDKHETEITQKLGGNRLKTKYRIKSATGGSEFAAVQVDTDKKGLEAIAKDPSVAFVELDAVTTVAPIVVNSTNSADAETGAATLVHTSTWYWGLARISHRLRGFWTYVHDNSACAGTRVYVLDTGIRRTHKEFRNTASFTWPFSGIRASYGANFIAGQPSADQHGHGTHCAGTAVGYTSGVCPRASVVSVKVLGASGTGSLSGLIAGLQWSANHAISTNYRYKSVISISIEAGYSAAVNAAVQAVINAGIPVVVAAGNSNINAWNVSPASAANAITVGAVDINDRRASFSNWGSNYGTALDIFGPGVSVRSAYYSSDTSYAYLSGTSQATPHVAGLLAYFIAKDGTTGPANLRTQLVNLATANTVVDPKGSFNRLAYNGNGF